MRALSNIWEFPTGVLSGVPMTIAFGGFHGEPVFGEIPYKNLLNFEDALSTAPNFLRLSRNADDQGQCIAELPSTSQLGAVAILCQAGVG